MQVEQKAFLAVDSALLKHIYFVLTDLYGGKYRIFDLSSLNPEEMGDIAEYFYNRDYYFQYSWLYDRQGKIHNPSSIKLDGESQRYIKNNCPNWNIPTDLLDYNYQKVSFLKEIEQYFPGRADDAISHIALFLKSNLAPADFAGFCKFLGGNMDEDGKVSWIQRFKSLDYPDNFKSIKSLLYNVFWCMEEHQNTAGERFESILFPTAKALDWDRDWD